MSTAEHFLKRYSVNDMVTEKRITGNLGEDFAENYFKKQGFTTKRNYHSRYGEIDIIAENEEYILFVEVKTRKADSLSAPKAAVDYKKQQKMILTAQDFLAKNETEKCPRFDVLEVFHNEGRIYKFNHISSAFDAG